MKPSRPGVISRRGAISALALGIMLHVAPGLAKPAAAYVDIDSQTYMQYPLEPGNSTIPMDVNPVDVNPTPTSSTAPSAPARFIPTPAAETLAGWQVNFLNQAIVAAQQAQSASGVPASVTIAQAILESNWGTSTIGGNNYFGIKATNSPGPAGVVLATTQEFVNGAWITVQAPFRAYYSMTESFQDHAQFFIQNSRYADAMQHAADPKMFAQLINEAGYATDPNYATKLIGLMDRYDLYRYDVRPIGG